MRTFNLVALILILAAPAAVGDGFQLSGHADARLERAPSLDASEEGRDGPLGDRLVVDTGSVELRVGGGASPSEASSPEDSARASDGADGIRFGVAQEVPAAGDVWLLPDGGLRLEGHGNSFTVLLEGPLDARPTTLPLPGLAGASSTAASPGGDDAAPQRTTTVRPDVAPACAKPGVRCPTRSVAFLAEASPKVSVVYGAPQAAAAIQPTTATAFAFDAESDEALAAPASAETHELAYLAGIPEAATPRFGSDAPTEPPLDADAPGAGAASAEESAVALAAPSAPGVGLEWDANDAVAVAAGSIVLVAPFAVWLFHRLTDRREVLDDPSRARVLDAIRLAPGATATDLERATGFHRTTAAYHARRLQQAGYVSVVREGGVNRYFTGDTPTDTSLRYGVCLLRYEPLKRIVVWLSTRPEATPRDLSAALAVSRRAISYHLQRLLDANLVEREAAIEGGHRIRVTELGLRALRENGAPASPAVPAVPAAQAAPAEPAPRRAAEEAL